MWRHVTSAFNLVFPSFERPEPSRRRRRRHVDQRSLSQQNPSSASSLLNKSDVVTCSTNATELSLLRIERVQEDTACGLSRLDSILHSAPEMEILGYRRQKLGALLTVNDVSR